MEFYLWCSHLGEIHGHCVLLLKAGIGEGYIWGHRSGIATKDNGLKIGELYDIKIGSTPGQPLFSTMVESREGRRSAWNRYSALSWRVEMRLRTVAARSSDSYSCGRDCCTLGRRWYWDRRRALGSIRSDEYQEFRWSMWGVPRGMCLIHWGWKVGWDTRGNRTRFQWPTILVLPDSPKG